MNSVLFLKLLLLINNIIIYAAYLQKYDCNVILVDYTDLAAQSYSTLVDSGNQIDTCSNYMVASWIKDCGIPGSSMHFTGHSFGAQASGGAAKGNGVARITGRKRKIL